MIHFVECTGCGFVLKAEASTDPEPKRRDSCPDCGETEFTFTDE